MSSKIKMTRLEHDGYEQVVLGEDEATGLRSIIAVHSTKLGPSMGGTRIRPYPTHEAGLQDALLLSKAMSYKSSLAGLNLGGGKAVIFADPAKDKTDALLEAYGRFVNQLDGAYIATVDSGSTSEDMNIIKRSTKFVAGCPEEQGGRGGPSPLTAVGVAEGIQASLHHVCGSMAFMGKKIAIQGIGNVGFRVAKILYGQGAHLTVSDTNKEFCERARSEFGAKIVSPESMHTVECTVFSPCAYGGILNSESVTELRCKIVAGAANNQLQTDDIARELHKREITYVPDFLINAGGIIQVGIEWEGADQSKADEMARDIGETVTRVLERAEEEDRLPVEIAVKLAEERIASAPSA